MQKQDTKTKGQKFFEEFAVEKQLIPKEHTPEDLKKLLAWFKRHIGSHLLTRVRKGIFLVDELKAAEAVAAWKEEKKKTHLKKAEHAKAIAKKRKRKDPSKVLEDQALRRVLLLKKAEKKDREKAFARAYKIYKTNCESYSYAFPNAPFPPCYTKEELQLGMDAPYIHTLFKHIFRMVLMHEYQLEGRDFSLSHSLFDALEHQKIYFVDPDATERICFCAYVKKGLYKPIFNSDGVETGVAPGYENFLEEVKLPGVWVNTHLQKLPPPKLTPHWLSLYIMEGFKNNIYFLQNKKITPSIKEQLHKAIDNNDLGLVAAVLCQLTSHTPDLTSEAQPILHLLSHEIIGPVSRRITNY
jgi:hypothetical protein